MSASVFCEVFLTWLASPPRSPWLVSLHYCIGPCGVIGSMGLPQRTRNCQEQGQHIIPLCKPSSSFIPAFLPQKYFSQMA